MASNGTIPSFARDTSDGSYCQDLTFNVRPTDIQKDRTLADSGMTGSKPLERQERLAGGATHFGFNPCLRFIQQR